MVKRVKKTKSYKPGLGYTKRDWDAVDSPPLTAEEMAQARPFKDVFPDLADSIEKEIAKRGRPPQDTTKIQVTLRLDPDIVRRYKKTGRGWQSRINEDLRKISGIK